MSQLQRDQLFSTGNVLDARECPTYSLQKEYLRGFEVRPLTVVLWGMHDRYGIANELGIEAIEAESHYDACCVCQDMRHEDRTETDDEGHTIRTRRWTPLVIAALSG